MKALLFIVMACGSLSWAAGDTDGPGAGANVLRAAATSVAGATAMAPAESGAPPVAGPRDRQGDAPRRREPGPPEPLAPAEMDRLMKFTGEIFPPIHERLEQLRRANPQAFQTAARRIYGRLKTMMDMKQTNPAAAEKLIEDERLQMVIVGLAERYRNARSDEERALLKSEIETRLQERFDRRQKRTRALIERLRERLDEQERQLAEREQNRGELLRQEFNRMTKSSSRPLERGPNKPAAGRSESPPVRSRE
jgi:hypothetical protein